MKYEILARTYAEIEASTSRLAMTDLLAGLFRQTPVALLARVVYLTQGTLYPSFEGIEIGIAEKMAARAIANATGVDPDAVNRQLSRLGDLGSVTEALLVKQQARRATLTVDGVYEALDRAARASGKGAQTIRLDALAELIRRATPLEARYIVRLATGNLRLGVGDMTMLDALALVYGGGRTSRKVLERAYNLTSDLGFVADTVASHGLDAIQKIHVIVGKPIRPMLAERLGDPEEIMQKLGGRCIAEYKYDGERLQIHARGEQVDIFSRRLEKITSQYPDVADLVRQHLAAKEAIIEGEVVAIDAVSGDLRPFQELMPRRRKYGIEEAMKEIPTALYVFDALYVDGKDLTQQTYRERHVILAAIMKPADRFRMTTYREVASARELEELFEQAVQDGCEGLMCKAPGGAYQAGARGWQWIKLKREYRSEMTDAVDLVAVGAFHGRGRRAGTYGALLMAAYDPEEDVFRTACKLGSGFSDEVLAAMPKQMKPYIRPTRPARVDSRMVPDVWLEPALVYEVIGAEITLSPVHTAGWDLFRNGSGLAIRFPRLTRPRTDKGPSDATTVQEIADMYRRRLKKAV